MSDINIGIDIDGTLSKYPDFFVELGNVWRRAGHKVFIITGLGHGEAIGKLKEYGADFYDQLLDTSLYNDEEINLIGRVVNNEIIVGKFKQRMCRENGVAIVFDDQARIHRLMGGVPIFEVA
jgi:hydroxymethylpyrimidine pyrophosphatase-like HAD family hydrolase